MCGQRWGRVGGSYILTRYLDDEDEAAECAVEIAVVLVGCLTSKKHSSGLVSTAVPRAGVVPQQIMDPSGLKSTFAEG